MKFLDDYKDSLYESKSYTEVTFQNLSIRGKAVYLKIKRRRWRLKSDLGKIVRTNFQFVSEGAGFTQEILSF